MDKKHPLPWCHDCEDLPVGECGLKDHRVELISGMFVQPVKRVGPGPIEEAIEADLAGMSDRIKPGKLALAAAARKLARVLDARGDEEPASQTAKAVDTLRITMNQIASGEGTDANVQEQLADLLGRPGSGGSAVSAEIRYPKEPR